MTLNTKIAPSGNILDVLAAGSNGAPASPLFALTDTYGNLAKWTDNGDGTCTLATTAGQVITGTAITASSGNVANANAVATLPGVAGKTTYINGFILTASGSTSGLPVVATVAGVITGTLSFIFTFPAGVLVAATPLSVHFAQPIPASAANTAIVVALPAGGSGNTNAAASAYGFQL
jgi:hypothetical protein